MSDPTKLLKKLQKLSKESTNPAVRAKALKAIERIQLKLSPPAASAPAPAPAPTQGPPLSGAGPAPRTRQQQMFDMVQALQKQRQARRGRPANRKTTARSAPQSSSSAKLAELMMGATGASPAASIGSPPAAPPPRKIKERGPTDSTKLGASVWRNINLAVNQGDAYARNLRSVMQAAHRHAMSAAQQDQPFKFVPIKSPRTNQMFILAGSGQSFKFDLDNLSDQMQMAEMAGAAQLSMQELMQWADQTSGPLQNYDKVPGQPASSMNVDFNPPWMAKKVMQMSGMQQPLSPAPKPAPAMQMKPPAPKPSFSTVQQPEIQA